MKRCPSCQSRYRSRLKRKGIQSLFFLTNYYICVRCRTKYRYHLVFKRSIQIKKE